MKVIQPFDKNGYLQSPNKICDSCNHEAKVLIYVDEAEKKLCFKCHMNRYGMDRFLRQLRRMKPEHQVEGFQ